MFFTSPSKCHVYLLSIVKVPSPRRDLVKGTVKFNFAKVRRQIYCGRRLLGSDGNNKRDGDAAAEVLSLF